MRDRGCKQVVAVTDRDVYGRGLGTLVRQDAARLGLQVVRTVRIGRSTRSFGRIRGADCVVYTGVTANGAVRMFRSVGARLRSAQLFASDGVAESGLHRPAPRLGRPARHGHRRPRSPRTPTPARAIIGTADPYKIYGYEAMKLILDGLNAAARPEACSATCAPASRTARACSAPTRSTPTATPRCAPTASTPSSASSSRWVGAINAAKRPGRSRRVRFARAARCRRA